MLRLRRTISRAAVRSSFYRDRLLQASGSGPLLPESLADIACLPFTTVEDLTVPERFLAVPFRDVGHVLTTTGATADPKGVYFTFQDFLRIVNLGAGGMGFLDSLSDKSSARPIALIALLPGLWIGAQQTQGVIERAGGLALPVALPPPDQCLRLIRDFRPNLPVTSPSYLGAPTLFAEQRTSHPQIPRIVLGGELLTNDRKEEFAAFWSAAITNSYGMTEIGGAQAFALPGCRALHVVEVHLLAEIVSTESSMPAERDELVFTTLARDAMPLIRYRSGDLAHWDECACDLPFRACTIEGRVGGVFVVGGTNLSASAIAAAVSTLSGVTGRVEILLERSHLVDSLTLRVERLPASGASKADVRRVLFGTHPDVQTSEDIGALILRVEFVELLDSMMKAYRVQDRHAG